MTRYNTFLTIFILSFISLIIFLAFYMEAIFSLATTLYNEQGNKPSPFFVFSSLFNPAVIISAVILGCCSLAYRILGIVYVDKNKTVSDGEKALWIIGFIIMGFITGIVFLVMAKGRKIVE